MLLASRASATVSPPVTAVLETAPVETALATETAETPFIETSPTQTDVTSPGYALEKPRLVVQLPGSSILLVTLDGQQTPIAAEAPKGLFASGFGVTPCGPAR
jgi:hypothetical protein